MAGVGEERHGVREHAVYRLDQHECEIQADASAKARPAFRGLCAP